MEWIETKISRVLESRYPGDEPAKHTAVFWALLGLHALLYLVSVVVLAVYDTKPLLAAALVLLGLIAPYEGYGAWAFIKRNWRHVYIFSNISMIYLAMLVFLPVSVGLAFIGECQADGSACNPNYVELGIGALFILSWVVPSVFHFPNARGMVKALNPSFQLPEENAANPDAPSSANPAAMNYGYPGVGAARTGDAQPLV